MTGVIGVTGVSCVDCVFYVPPDKVKGLVGKEIGGAVCQKRGELLLLPHQVGNVGQKARDILTPVAEACSFYHEPAASTPAPITVHRAFQPGGEYLILVGKDDSGVNDTDPDMRVNSCRSCAAFIPPTEVTGKTGLTGVGICGSRNGLIPMNTATTTANTCRSEDRTWSGSVSRTHDLDDVEFFERFGMQQDVFSNGGTVVDIFLENTEPVPDPRNFETESPVSDADKKRGIRAWRKVFNPGRPNQFVLLPVFSPDLFSEDDRDKIPQIDDPEHPELYIDYSNAIYRVAVMWLQLADTPAVWGEPGVGKTELFRHLAWLMQLPFERISITATSEVDDLIGKMLFVNDETTFNYGRLPLAWQRPCVVVLDEPNVAPPEVWQAIRPLTDNSKQMVIDQNDGERIPRHPDCYMAMAMNPAWDNRNSGTETIADADSSRLMHIFIGLPDEKIEMKIISDRIKKDGWTIHPDNLKQVMTVAKDIRRMSQEGSISISWGIRHQIKATRGLKWLTPVDAYKIAAADFLEPDEAKMIIRTVTDTIKTMEY